MSDVMPIPATPHMRHGSNAGQPLTRRDGVLKVTGAATYAADNAPAGLLHAVVAHARIARGLAVSAGAQGYAAAVRQLGASALRLYGRHVLPNIASTLIVSMTLVFPEVILLESGLSFLGLGVQPPATSLGNMVGYGREYLTRAPWILLSPASIIVLTTLSVSLVGDWLRDRLDPTLR